MTPRAWWEAPAKDQDARPIRPGARRRLAREPFTSRFFRFVEIDLRPDACWRWLGYYRPTINGRRPTFRAGVPRNAARALLSYMEGLNGRELHDGDLCCHRCDNSACVRPDHLYVGTATENMRDWHRSRKTNARRTAWREISEPDGSTVGGSSPGPART